MPPLQQLCREKRIILWFALVLRNYIYTSESDWPYIKERCVYVYNITRAKMKPVLHRAFLDSPTRISVNWVLSLANRIYMQSV